MGGGVIVASHPELGTVVLAAHHVVRDAEHIRVGVFRHSRIDGGGPEFVRYPAEIVVAGFILDERIAEPIRELGASCEALLDAADSPGRFPGLEAQLQVIGDAVRRIESARDSAGFMAGLDRLRQGLGSTSHVFTEEFGDAMKVVSEKRSPEEGTRLGQRVTEALGGILR